MQVLTQDKSIVPKVANSAASGSHVSIYIPIEPGETFQATKLRYTNMMAKVRELLTRSETVRTTNYLIKSLDKALDSYGSREESPALLSLSRRTPFSTQRFG